MISFTRMPEAVFRSTLVGMVLLTMRPAPGSRAAAEEFQPIREAEMPEGFPGYTLVGQIEVKHYPAYRKAAASGAAEFWTLFRHIRENGVKMTAPVEMEYGDPDAENPTKESMSFLYERRDQGTVGRQGSVEVVDVPPMTVLSIGRRGSRTPEAIADAREKLLKYVAENRDKYAVAGPMRVMGYNSPFVPRDKNFFEVQIPVINATED